MKLPGAYRILTAWNNEGETLTYTQIKRCAINKGIISETNDRSLSRWLKRLVREDLLEKTEKGYVLKAKPKMYRVFDYLNEIRQKSAGQIYDGEVGGIFSHICASTYLSFDETLIKTREERIAFDIISIRIGELFWALYELRNALLKRNCGLPRLRLPDEVIRETFLGTLVEGPWKHLETEELLGTYSKHMIPAQEKTLASLFDINRRKSEANNESLLEPSLFFDEIEKDPESYKKELKKRASIDLDKYSAEELLEKLARIVDWVHKNHEKEMKKRHGFSYTKEESELESNYRMAVLTKVAEGIKARHSTTQDFAIILTRHPATLDDYYTPEHILHEAIEWAKKPPEDDWGRRIWKESYENEKTFEGVVAEHLVVFGWRHPVRTYAKMRLAPWLEWGLKGEGDFDAILKLYSQKRKSRLEEHRKRIKQHMKRMSEFSKNASQKSID